MDSYAELIHKVLKCQELASQIQTLASDEETLNLIVPDWEKRLENNVTYQKFKNNAKDMYGPKKTTESNVFTFQNMKNNQSMRVLFLANCGVYSAFAPSKYTNQIFSAVVRDTPVMDMLMKGLNSDVNLDDVEFSETCKINFRACSRDCKYCSFLRNELKKNNIPTNFECIQPCVTDTAVYDGKQVVNRFASQIANGNFGGYKAIIQMDITLRYFYTGTNQLKPCVRLGGTALKMIAFPESNLKEALVVLGNLASMPNQTEKEVNEPPKLCNETIDFSDGPEKRSLDSEDETLINIMPHNKTQKTNDATFSVSEESILFN